jgi:hypothetical protein
MILPLSSKRRFPTDVQLLLLVHVALYLLIFIGGFYRFEENDDVLMMLISSGNWGVETSEYLVFIHVLLGLLFKSINAVLGIPNSYLWFFMLASLLSHLFIIWSIRRLAGPEHFVKAYLILLPILFHTVFFLQFTTLAYSLALAGLFGIFLVIGKKYTPWASLGLAWFFFSLSFLVRKEVALVVVAFLLMYVLLHHFFYKKGGVLRLFLFFGVLMVQFFLLHAWDKDYYERGGFSDFWTYNQLRGMLQDNPTPQVLQACFQENGFSESAFLLFRQASLPYTPPARLQPVLECQRVQKAAAPIHHYIKRIPGDTYYFFYYSTPWSVCLLLFLLLLIFGYNTSLRPSLGYFLGISLLLVLVILLEKNLKERVVFFLLHLPVVFALFRSFLDKKPLVLPGWGLGLYLIALVVYLASASLNTVASRKEYAGQFQQLQQVAALKDKTLILAGRYSTSALPYLSYFTGSPAREFTAFSQVYMSGWFSGSPTAHAYLQRRGAATFLDLLQSGEGVLLTDTPDVQAVLETYAREEYNRPLRLRTTQQKGLPGLYFIQSY